MSQDVEGGALRTDYKWQKRYQALGVGGLHDQCRPPNSWPSQPQPDVVALILQEYARSGWGMG